MKKVCSSKGAVVRMKMLFTIWEKMLVNRMKDLYPEHKGPLQLSNDKQAPNLNGKKMGK